MPLKIELSAVRQPGVRLDQWKRVEILSQIQDFYFNYENKTFWGEKVICTEQDMTVRRFYEIIGESNEF